PSPWAASAACTAAIPAVRRAFDRASASACPAGAKISALRPDAGRSGMALPMADQAQQPVRVHDQRQLPVPEQGGALEAAVEIPGGDPAQRPEHQTMDAQGLVDR